MASDSSGSQASCILKAWGAWPARTADAALETLARASLLVLASLEPVQCVVALADDQCEWPLLALSSSNGKTSTRRDAASMPLSASLLAPVLQHWHADIARGRTPSVHVAAPSASLTEQAVICAAPIVVNSELVGAIYLSRHDSSTHAVAVDASVVDTLSLHGRALAQHLQLILDTFALSRSHRILQSADRLLTDGPSSSSVPLSPTATSERQAPWRINNRIFVAIGGAVPIQDTPLQPPRRAGEPDLPPLQSRDRSSSHSNALGTNSHALYSALTQTKNKMSSIFESAGFALCQTTSLVGCVFLDLQTGKIIATARKNAQSGETSTFEARDSNHISDSISLADLHTLVGAYPRGQVLKRQESDAPDATSPIKLAGSLDNILPLEATHFALLGIIHPSEAFNVSCLAWSCETSLASDPTVLVLAMSAFSRIALANAISSQVAVDDMAKSRFLGSVTHELRSPLHGIMGGLEFLRRAKLDVFDRHMIDTVQSCSRTLLDMIEDVLAVSGLNQAPSIIGSPVGDDLEHNLMTEDASAYSMVDLIEDVITSCLLGHITRQRAFLQGDASESQLEGLQPLLAGSESAKLLIPRLPQVIIRTDWSKDWVCTAPPNSVRRIILSLFSNSLKFTDTGHIVISSLPAKDETIALSHAGSVGTDLDLIITDTGCGMGKDFLSSQAGTAFRQEDSLQTGVGLGLTLADQVLQNLGGDLQMKSDIGSGTVARVRIPSSRLEEYGSCVEGSFACDLRPYTKGKSMFLLGWKMPEQKRDQQSLHLARDAFAALFRDRFHMVVEHGTDEVVGAPDVILCDDLCFEVLRGNGVIDELIETHPAFLVFCSSIRYAATMSSSYPQISFLTPPPGPAQLSRVMRRYFVDNIRPATSASSGDQNAKVATFADKTDGRRATPFQEPRPLQSENPDKANLGSRAEIPLSPSETVLLVEDNAINLQLLVKFCSRNSLSYLTAENGLAAVQIYQEAAVKPALVLMDVNMPVMNGLEATRQIRQTEQATNLRPTKIVAITAAVTPDAANLVYQAGCNHFMAKPATFKKLMELVKTLDLS